MPSESDQIAELRVEVARQGRIIDALAKHLGVSQNDLLSGRGSEAPADVVEALQAGNLIEAIKRWRAATNDGLAESKAAVEAIQNNLR